MRETIPCQGRAGRSWLWVSGETLTPMLCLGASTELSFQQDNQDSGPEEALGEHPLAYLLGADGGRWPAHHPDCVAGHLPPTEKRGQQCPTGPGCECCLGAWGLTQLGLEERLNGRTGWFWAPKNLGICSHLSLPSECLRAAPKCAPLHLLSCHRLALEGSLLHWPCQANPTWSSVNVAAWLKSCCLVNSWSVCLCMCVYL